MSRAHIERSSCLTRRCCVERSKASSSRSAATDASLREEREQADAGIEEGTDKLEHTQAVIDELIEANGA